MQREPNPVVANPSVEASPAEFQAPRRPMGKTGIEISIIGMGGYHLGTAAGQAEVNNMVAKAMITVSISSTTHGNITKG